MMQDFAFDMFLSETLEVLRHRCILYTQDVIKGSLVTRYEPAPTQVESRTTEVLNVGTHTEYLGVEELQKIIWK